MLWRRARPSVPIQCVVNLPLPNSDDLAKFCAKWQVTRLWLFGSVARGDATATSDVDLLAEFAPSATTSTWDWPDMQDELERLFNRRVDLLSTGILRNPYRRRTIEASRRLLYAA